MILLYAIKFLSIFILYTSAATISTNNSNKKCEFPAEFLSECGRILNNTPNPEKLKQLFPWHVALYKKKYDGNDPINTCGGTLISKNVLLTAAHCLAEDSNGALRDISEYFVLAGNDYREFNDARDTENVQIREIKKVVIPKVYRGHGSNFIGDIAMVVVKQPFILTDVVQPACVGFSRGNLNENSLGVSVGWGLTTTSRHPDTRLSKLPVPFVTLSKCRQAVSNEFLKFLSNEDKFCGVFSNGASICATDNGGGVLYPQITNNQEEKLYLQGVASVGLISTGTCETTQYSAFTSIEPYLPELCDIINNTK